MPGGMKQLGSWFLQNRLQAAPSALVGLAGAATIGFMSSGGQTEGITAGMGGALGGGSSGLFSGALLGVGAGAAMIAAGKYSTTMRPYVGKWIGSTLSSAPVQSLTKMITQAPLGKAFVPHQKSLARYMGKSFLNPQGQAADFLIRMLENKQMQYRWAMGVGGVGGAIAGGIGGFGVGAWKGGSQLRGPMSQGY